MMTPGILVVAATLDRAQPLHVFEFRAAWCFQIQPRKVHLRQQIAFQRPAFESNHVPVVGPVLSEQFEDVPFHIARNL